jgi:hypothetical protein
MSDLRQAAQQALEALESVNYANYSWACVEAITALRAALEQDDRDRVWIEERKANWALQRKMAQENQERDRLQRFADSVDELGMEYERAGCDIAADGVCEALECCNVRTSALCPEQVQAQPEQDGSLIDEGSRQQEPVAWIQSNHLEQAQREPFLCRVEPTPRLPDFVPLYTHPPRREWRGLTEEDFNSPMFSVTSLGRCDVETIKSICKDAEAALKEKNA